MKFGVPDEGLEWKIRYDEYSDGRHGGKRPKRGDRGWVMVLLVAVVTGHEELREREVRDQWGERPEKIHQRRKFLRERKARYRCDDTVFMVNQCHILIAISQTDGRAAKDWATFGGIM